MGLPSAYLALGCNRGDRFIALNRVCSLLERRGILMARRSSVFVTRPLGSSGRPDAFTRRADYYFNAVVEVRTALRPLELYWRCRDVEREMGRWHRERWEPRVMDIDLVMYGRITMKHPALTLPHPGWLTRDFVLEPLRELGVPGIPRGAGERCIESRLQWH